ncbi:FMN-binding negative transcriptional regulator [Colwellia sp. MSW7]|uniref:FMN-binding negative transcriptional regulator n=1 Tax=Colwellia maritima TaxID=2912588 RepID=A0ABS9X3T9_9GAMM|nr:FMN-binding negative transcriptional regulator [Colwellia maritima]MCI2284908.1 FMN-binding negative transcriptional regulator [Colwellia maritima]
MHVPKVFQQDDPVALHELMMKYPLASLIAYSATGIEVNHIPFFLTNSTEELHGNTTEKLTLQGHIAKANPLWQNVKDNAEILLVFHGPNCYISPNYYPTKKEQGKAVPTWNYVAVHVKGLLHYRFDTDFKLAMLNNLTIQHEQNQEKPWSITDAPMQYIQRMLAAIVGLEIEILSITGKWKVSQNQPEINKQGLVVWIV